MDIVDDILETIKLVYSIEVYSEIRIKKYNSETV